MLCSTLAAHSSLFGFPKMRTDTLLCLCAPQDKLQDGEREGFLLMIKPFIQLWLENYLFAMLEKNATHVTYCFNNEFSNFLFQL